MYILEECRGQHFGTIISEKKRLGLPEQHLDLKQQACAVATSELPLVTFSRLESLDSNYACEEPSVTNLQTTSSALFKKEYKPVVKMEVASAVAVLPETRKLLLVVRTYFEIADWRRGVLTRSTFLRHRNVISL